MSIWVLKWQIATDKSKQDYSTTPNIHQTAVITFTNDHLRSSIARRSAGSFQFLMLLIRIAQAEINDFELIVIIKQKIFQFQIPMWYFHISQILDSRDELPEEETSLWLLKMALLDNKLEEFSLADVLGDKEEVAFGFDDLIADRVTS